MNDINMVHPRNIRTNIKYSFGPIRSIPTTDSSYANPYQPKKVREKSRKCHNYKPQPFPDTKRKRKPKKTSTNRTNERKALRLALSSPREVIAILKGLIKHKNKMTHGKTYNKWPRRINHKATKSKTNTATTALEWSVE